MASVRNPTTGQTSYQYGVSRPRTGKARTTRPRTGFSTLAGVDAQQVICAMSESRGISPIVGLAFMNLETWEAVLCQICDTQTYVRTMQKLAIRNPAQILMMRGAFDPKSKLASILEENMDELDCEIKVLDRKYFAEATGIDYIQQLAFAADVEAIKSSIAGNFFAVSCFAAAMKYVESELSMTLLLHSIRIKYEPSEGAMMIDLSTIYSLELIQNLQQPKSKDCLFGLLNKTQTPMGSRLLRSNILQPLTDPDTIKARHDALEELTTKEEMFFAIRSAFGHFVDADKLLTSIIAKPTMESIDVTEQNINKVIELRQFISSVRPVHEALIGAQSSLLVRIREHCSSHHVSPVEVLIDSVINDDIKYSKSPLDMRYQRIYAVKAGVHELLDVSRITYREGDDDIRVYCDDLQAEHGIKLELKYNTQRQYYLRFSDLDLDGKAMPEVFLNVTRRKHVVECTTMDLMKSNQKLVESHSECILMSDATSNALIDSIRDHASPLFKICESLAMLDIIAAFAHLVTSNDYVRPQISDTLGIKDGRHPIKEGIQRSKFSPNDVYATHQKRFQIITGCNMSGKSTYIRTVALLAVMAQIGCFVPATFASMPIYHQLFARVNVDDSIEANVSTFAAEMREMAYILRNIDSRSIVIIDELGRGTSTRDGLAIAIAIAEALVESGAMIWFATHFTEIAKIMGGRPGVIAAHLAVESPDPATLKMLYRVAPGPVTTASYGLTLARLVPLPTEVLTHATHVAKTLRENEARQKAGSGAVLTQRRRRLVLELREHLLQAQAGPMEGATLTKWLKDLQAEFVRRMSELEDEIATLPDEIQEDVRPSTVVQSESSMLPM